jgi:hypothetical protein
MMMHSSVSCVSACLSTIWGRPTPILEMYKMSVTEVCLGEHIDAVMVARRLRSWRAEVPRGGGTRPLWRCATCWSGSTSEPGSGHR